MSAPVVPLRVLRSACFEVVFAVYLLYGSEWLFQVTKPSFMSLLSAGEVFRVLVASPLYLVIPLVILQGMLLVLHGVASRGLGRVLPSPRALIPALLYSATALLLVDNFVYTMFGIGVVSLSGRSRALGAALLAGVFVWILVSRHRDASRRGRRSNNVMPLGERVLAALLVVAIVSTGWELASGHRRIDLETSTAGERVRRLPDILFITFDGVQADHTSLYGHERRTTPRLDAFAEEALVFENAFTNNLYTTGALIALLTGKLPADMKMFYPPMNLRGADAYEHLPGILRSLGYRSSQITVPYWASALSQGMRGAFDFVNFEDARAHELEWVPVELADRLPAQRDFLVQTRDRVVDRVLHLAAIEDMPDPMSAAHNLDEGQKFNDERRKQGVVDVLSGEHSQPSFVQVHLMSSHCCVYHVPPEHQHFTKGYRPTGMSLLHYDDAILFQDHLFGELVDWLEAEGRLDDMLIFFSSDHSKAWQTELRVPMLIRFPGGRPRGRVRSNAQLMDVAPTVLDHLGIPKPAWMLGRSLLDRDAVDPHRRIFSASGAEKAAFRMPTPPLYGLESYMLVVCDRWYRLSTLDATLVSGEVEGHSGGCDPDAQPTDTEARAILLDHLAARGFDVTGAAPARAASGRVEP